MKAPLELAPIADLRRSFVAKVPDEVALTTEFEVEDDETEFEIELTW